MSQIASNGALHKWVAVGLEVVGEEDEEALAD